MRKLLLIAILFNLSTSSHAKNFVNEARGLAGELKSSLMGELSKKISEKGVVSAISFCHENVSTIAQRTAGNKLKKYQVGRTSHKVRNAKNTPQKWMLPYLEEFQGKKKGEIKKEFILHRFKNSKRAYLEPLYVEARCLLCHGPNVAKDVESKIKALYPDDKATGFVLDEFRGFLWVKER